MTLFHFSLNVALLDYLKLCPDFRKFPEIVFGYQMHFKLHMSTHQTFQ